ncbi:MAG: hypothetical protein Q8906_10970 [Bacillota bacterium]|nr:hypothetical protein [Bacillota bacterium]
MNNLEHFRTNTGKQERLNQLIEEVLERHSHPEDVYEIVAILESVGWNDDQAVREFGANDLFDLSIQIWEMIKSKLTYVTFHTVEKQSMKQISIEMIRSFLRGLIFAFPMAVSVISMLTLRYSLWSYENLSVEQATAIAIGTILSFITVGGVTQAIARRGFFYIIQGYFHLAKKNTFIFIRIGYLLCIALGVGIYVLNMMFNFFPFRMFSLIILFFFFLNAIWLSVTVMYILKKELVFTGLIILGIFIVFIFFELLGMNIILAQIIALCLISISSMFLVFYFFKKEIKKSEKGINLQMPKISITFYSVGPYFFYGFLYFTFLFVDRVISWSTNDQYMPYVIWFRGSYELGLDFALLVLMIPMGVSEVIVNKLMKDLENSQKNYLAIESKEMYREFYGKYKRMFSVNILSGIASAFLIYLFVLNFDKIPYFIGEHGLISSKVTRFVLLWGVVGYVIVSICLMNAVILFALSQPSMVIKAIFPALLINIFSGFLLTRWFHYEDAVFGLVLGAIYMSSVSTYYVRKVLKNIDYYLYAAS